jgi:nucleotide-binding universal stress UspA family protein
MVDIQRILCPIDFSDASRHALEHAAASATWYGAQLTVVHVSLLLNAAVMSDEIAVLPPPRPQTDVIDAIRRFCASVITGGSPEIVVAEGNPAKEIVLLAERMAADLLVMGTHGRGGFERLFLGSVTEKVLRTTLCPVLTVPPPIQTPSADPVVYKTILCPVDFSDTSSRALQYASSLANETDARLILLHVVEGVIAPPDVDINAHFNVPEYHRYLEEDAMARLKTAIPGEARRPRSEERVTSGKPFREILRVAAETNAELIVMGVRGRGAVERWVFGSTTHHVLREARRAVLTLRTDSPAPASDADAHLVPS